jgi:hypothetical protein
MGRNKTIIGNVIIPPFRDGPESNACNVSIDR